MSKAAYHYPPDEFDASSGPDTPRGVHRAPRSPWARWWPFLAVLVVVPALAWGVVTVVSNGGLTSPGGTTPAVGTSTAGTSPEVTAPETVPETLPGTVPETVPPVEEPPPPAEPTADMSAPVAVLNGAGIGGLAARTVEKLNTAGFTSVLAGNYSAAEPVASTVFYASDDLRATAELVGTTIGVTTYVMSPVGAGTAAVTVVLRTDPGA